METLSLIDDDGRPVVQTVAHEILLEELYRKVNEIVKAINIIENVELNKHY